MHVNCFYSHYVSLVTNPIVCCSQQIHVHTVSQITLCISNNVTIMRPNSHSVHKLTKCVLIHIMYQNFKMYPNSHNKSKFTWFTFSWYVHIHIWCVNSYSGFHIQKLFPWNHIMCSTYNVSIHIKFPNSYNLPNSHYVSKYT